MWRANKRSEVEGGEEGGQMGKVAESDGASTKPLPVLSLQILCTQKWWGRVSRDLGSM